MERITYLSGTVPKGIAGGANMQIFALVRKEDKRLKSEQADNRERGERERETGTQLPAGLWPYLVKYFHSNSICRRSRCNKNESSESTP